MRYRCIQRCTIDLFMTATAMVCLNLHIVTVVDSIRHVQWTRSGQQRRCRQGRRKIQSCTCRRSKGCRESDRHQTNECYWKEEMLCHHTLNSIVVVATVVAVDRSIDRLVNQSALPALSLSTCLPSWCFASACCCDRFVATKDVTDVTVEWIHE